VAVCLQDQGRVPRRQHRNNSCYITPTVAFVQSSSSASIRNHEHAYNDRRWISSSSASSTLNPQSSASTSSLSSSKKINDNLGNRKKKPQGKKQNQSNDNADNREKEPKGKKKQNQQQNQQCQITSSSEQDRIYALETSLVKLAAAFEKQNK
jgi:hypothetical protein